MLERAREGTAGEGCHGHETLQYRVNSLKSFELGLRGCAVQRERGLPADEQLGGPVLSAFQAVGEAPPPQGWGSCRETCSSSSVGFLFVGESCCGVLECHARARKCCRQQSPRLTPVCRQAVKVLPLGSCSTTSGGIMFLPRSAPAHRRLVVPLPRSGRREQACLISRHVYPTIRRGRVAPQDTCRHRLRLVLGARPGSSTRAREGASIGPCHARNVSRETSAHIAPSSPAASWKKRARDHYYARNLRISACARAFAKRTSHCPSARLKRGVLVRCEWPM